MTRKPDKAKVCSDCGEPLGQARLVVHDPNGISGEFCVDKFCYSNAVAGKDGVKSEPLPIPHRASA